MISLVISHGDVDGMVCAAQLIRQEGAGCGVVYSNAKKIGLELGKIAGDKDFPSRLFVTDIPANEACMEPVRKLVDAGVDVSWVDHHPWPEGLREQLEVLCEKVIHNVALSTPAGILLGQWLGERDEFCRRIGRICYAYEKGSEWERNWFRLLSSYVGKSTRGVLERLASDAALTPDDLCRIARKVDDERAALQLLQRDNPPVQTKQGRKMVIFDTFSGKQDLFLGKKVFKYHNADYALVRLSERKWQLAVNPGHPRDISHLSHTTELAAMHLRTGGRWERLIAIDVDERTIPANAHEMIVNWLADSL